MKLLPEHLESLLSTLDCLEREERIQMLIGIADHFQCVPPRIAERPFAAEHRVPGCESEAYVWSEERPDGTQTYYFAVENPQGISAMALAEILRDTLSGAPLAEIAGVPADIVYRIFGRELSMGKSLGLMGVVNMVCSAARQQMHKVAAGTQVSS